MHREAWPNAILKLYQRCFIMQILLFNQLSTTYWQQKCCGRGKECWYYSITLNKPLMPVWKTFHKLFLDSSSRLICCIPSITRANPNPLWSFQDPRDHDPLKILTVLLMRTRNSGGWGGSWNWSEPSWKFAGSEKVWAARPRLTSHLNWNVQAWTS